MKNIKVTSVVENFFKPLEGVNGLELVDIEFVKEGGSHYLRVFIDKPGGITLEDCQMVNEEISQGLDREDPIPQSYILEVSSPGLNRPLKKEKDFQRFAGQDVKIKTFVPVGEQKVFKGVLKGMSQGKVLVKTEKGVAEIPLDKIAKANLLFEF